MIRLQFFVLAELSNHYFNAKLIVVCAIYFVIYLKTFERHVTRIVIEFCKLATWVSFFYYSDSTCLSDNSWLSLIIENYVGVNMKTLLNLWIYFEIRGPK